MRVASVIGWGLAAMAVTTTTPGALAPQDTDSTGTSDVFDVQTYVATEPGAGVGGWGVYSISNHHPSLSASVRFDVFVTVEYGETSWRQHLAQSRVTLAPGQGIVQSVSFTPPFYPRYPVAYPGVFACRASATFQGDPVLRAFGADFSPFIVWPFPLCIEPTCIPW